MRPPSILFVSESASTTDLITNGEFTVDDVTVAGALRFTEAAIPDLILLKLTALEAQGEDPRLIWKLHMRCPSTPIVVTCMDCSTAQRLHTLQAGADDFFCESLTSAETLEKIRAKLRRVMKQPLSHEIFAGRHLFADFADLEIRVDGTLVTLTRRELELLSFLVEHRNTVLSREVILHGVWRSIDVHCARTVDTHIRRLRQKLGAAGRQIETLPRYGWRFVEPTPA